MDLCVVDRGFVTVSEDSERFSLATTTDQETDQTQGEE